MNISDVNTSIEAKKHVLTGIEEGDESVEIAREAIEEARRDVPRALDLENEK